MPATADRVEEAMHVPDVEPIPVPQEPIADAPTPIGEPQRRYPQRTRKPTRQLIEEEGFGMYLAAHSGIFMGRALINQWRLTQSDY
jgi:hypothetical protein